MRRAAGCATAPCSSSKRSIPESVRHVFSTTKQTQLDDSYFYESGDKIRFFLEDDAFDDEGVVAPVEGALPEQDGPCDA